MLKLFRFLKPWRIQMIALLLLVFFQVISDLFLPTLMADIIDHGVLLGDTAYILNIGSVMLLISLLSIACAVGASWLSSTVSAKFGQTLRSRVFTQVSKYSLHEFDKFGASTLITRATNDITQVQTVTIMISRMFLIAPIMAMGGLVMAYLKDPELTWIFAVAVPALLAVIILIALKAMPLFSSIQKKVDKLNTTLREGLAGVRVIRAFNRVDHEQSRFDAASDDLSTTYITVNRLMAFMMPGLMLVMNLTSLAILWFGFDRIEQGTLQLGALIAFTQYAMQILFSFMMMSMLFNLLPRAQAAAKRINEVLELQPSMKDHLDCEVAEDGSVEFDNVTFRYPGAEVAALNSISFKAEPGKVTAIIGSTGSGKSTLLRMIPRFYDCSEGDVRVGGKNVTNISQVLLRSNIGFVPQKAQLFSGSVKENLKVANSAAPESQLDTALATAQANFVSSELAHGIDERLSGGGANLSGGQKQRLSIARALTRQADIYLFDDCFSALDFKTDAKLRAALKPKMANSTVIIVAQRVATVKDADQILVMDEGNIVGRGRHEALLQQCSTYREIVESQSRVEGASND